MKTPFTFGRNKNNFAIMPVFFLCFLFSLNLHSQKIQSSLKATWKNGNWENVIQTMYTYDSSDYLIHDLTQNWDTSWKDYLQNDYTNNPDGTLNQSISQSWNTGSSLWDNFQKVTYTYNAAKNILTSESEIWYDPVWMPVFKETNTYDGSGYLTNSLSQNWDFISSWENTSQTIYTNNPDGTVNQILTQNWNVIAWTDAYRLTYTYSGSKPIVSVFETWTGTIWENVSRTTYDYDGNGYLIHMLSQDWVTPSWKNFSQSNIANDGNGNPLEVISQNWDDINNVWINESKTTFTYGALAVKENVFEKRFAIYPNPAQDRITIKTNDNSLGLKYLVTDSTGRQLLNGTIHDAETVIDVNELASGVYFIQMGQNKNQTIKMLKK